MNFSPSALKEHARSEQGRKQLRYAGVSVVFVPLGQIIVQILHAATSIADPVNILIVAGILTIPNYFANKIYVWREQSNDRMRTQITVFWIAAMLGTGFAMGLAYIADEITKDMPKFWQGVWLFAAQLTGYGIVWVARFIFLDRWIFKATHHGEEPPSDELAELHADLPI